jgi:large subunit ribosomal protein L15
MRLDSLKPAPGSKKKKQIVGRGIGSGSGKTCKRGHKGQRSRSGATRNTIGFEGGQMPLQMRLPKSGFSSRVSRVTEEVRLSEIEALPVDEVNLVTLKAANVISVNTRFVKIILSGDIKRAVKVEGLRVTAGAQKAIEAAGGQVVSGDTK